MDEKPTCPNPVQECNFGADEIAELRRVGQRESVAFPKWAMGLLIAILGGLAASNGAIWLGLADKATGEQLIAAEAKLTAELVLARERLVKLEATVPKEYPPKWFEQQFRDLVVTVTENNKLLNDLRVNVAELKNAQKP